MQLSRMLMSLSGVMALGLTTGSVRAEITAAELRAELEALRKQLNEHSTQPAPIKRVDALTDNKMGPNAAVTTKTGRLEISGLLQIWNYSIDNDHQDVFGDRGGFAGTGGTGEAIDNNSYRIRRAEIKFTMDIHENITGVVMIDAAREATSFPNLPSNQGNFKANRENGPDSTTGRTAAVRSGAGQVPTLLQDAYINYHGVIPHHDFTFGQFKPPVGEEGTRSNAYLDFAERAMVTQLNDFRDIGAQVHGTWWEDRFQYWAGVFNGPGNYFGTAGQFQNRSDDNDAKDIALRFLVRPLWDEVKGDCGCEGWSWGKLELGASAMFGWHGESGNPGAGDINGLNRRETSASRYAAWAMYKPAGVLRGWWLRGEYGYVRDRNIPDVEDGNVIGSVDALDAPLGLGPQVAPNAFSRQGFYASTGYKLTDSIFAERLNGGGFFNNLLRPVEFAFRYEKFDNILTQDLVRPTTRTDVFATDVLTVGVNYYVKAYNSRVQVNYLMVNEREDDTNPVRGLREVRNNAFVFTYQVNF